MSYLCSSVRLKAALPTGFTDLCTSYPAELVNDDVYWPPCPFFVRCGMCDNYRLTIYYVFFNKISVKYRCPRVSPREGLPTELYPRFALAEDGVTILASSVPYLSGVIYSASSLPFSFPLTLNNADRGAAQMNGRLCDMC